MHIVNTKSMVGIAAGLVIANGMSALTQDVFKELADADKDVVKSLDPPEPFIEKMTVSK